MLILNCFNGITQNNLVPNGSFEEIREDQWNRFVNANYEHATSLFDPDPEDTKMIMSHVGNAPDIGLVKCWRHLTKPGFYGNNDHAGICYLIAPGLRVVKDGTHDWGFSNGTIDDFHASWIGGDIVSNDPFIRDDFRILSTNTEGTEEKTPGIRLKWFDSDNVWGIDCSPPDTKFGQNMPAQHGTNYMSIVDFRRGDQEDADIFSHPNDDYNHSSSEPILVVKLTEKLVEGLDYRFQFSRAKMNQLDELKINGEWDQLVDPELEIKLGTEVDYNGVKGSTYEILDASFTTEGWLTIDEVFTANNEYEYLQIRLKSIQPQATAYNQNSRISGAFIDNVKLYLECDDENIWAICNNINYKKDVLDAELEVFELNDPLAFPDENQNDKDYMQTIKAKNLDHVNYIKIEIFDGWTNENLVRTIEETFPQSELIWDGDDQAGNPLPEGNYKAVLHIAANDCHFEVNLDSKNFTLKRKYTAFENIEITNESVPTINGSTISVPVIKGLDKVHDITIELISNNGAGISEVHSFTNPPDKMYLSFYDNNVNNYGLVSNLSNGIYFIRVFASNNCQSSQLGANWDHEITAYGLAINNNQYFDVADPTIFEWVFEPKPNFECPFNQSNNDNYLPPLDCCEGSLYISNVEILNDFEVNIQNDIVFGDNVSFGSNSNNVFYANNSIWGHPGVTVPLGANVSFVPGEYNCALCLYGPPNVSTSRDDEFISSGVDKVSHSCGLIFPNPVKKNTSLVTILPSLETKDIKSIRMIDLLGKEYEIEFSGNIASGLIIQLPKNLSVGVYFVHLDDSEFVQSFKFQIVD